MSATSRARSGRLVSAVVGMIVLVAALAAASTAMAAPAANLTINQRGPVIAFDCNACHGNISDTKVPNLIFKHAAHIIYDCSVCHTRFPHQPEGTSRPGMAACWSCHALRHGPQGQMARAECVKCHKVTGKDVKPKDHTKDWAKKPHVQPSVTGLRTNCMMCHTQAYCEDCHLKLNIFWKPKVPYTFDAGNSCLSCHGMELPRLSGPVTQVEASAHRENTCVECHPDFKYDDTENRTALWKINAAFACQTCHDQLKTAGKGPKLYDPAMYPASIHGQLLAKKDYKTATCSGCHGGHDILRTKTETAKVQLHMSSETMCGEPGCHSDFWANYNDYYHGAAYKKGASTAPACWDCHGYHDVLKKTDPKSRVNLERAPADACGKKGCHEGASESFINSTAGLIHSVDKTRADNPVQQLLDRIVPRG